MPLHNEKYKHPDYSDDDIDEMEQLFDDYVKRFGEMPPMFEYPDRSDLKAAMQQALKANKVLEEDVPDDIVT